MLPSPTLSRPAVLASSRAALLQVSLLGAAALVALVALTRPQLVGLPSVAALAAAFGYVAGITGVMKQWPQLWRTCVGGAVAGVSVTAAWVNLGNSLTWLTFGLLGGGAVQVRVNTVMAVLGLALVVPLLWRTPSARSALALAAVAGASAGWAAVLAVAYSAAGADGVALAGAVAGTLCGVPQLVLLVRQAGQDASGVSPASWWMNALNSALWLGHGLLMGQLVVAGPAVWNLAVSLGVIALLARGRRAADPAVDVPVPLVAPVALPASLSVSLPVSRPMDQPAAVAA